MSKGKKLHVEVVKKNIESIKAAVTAHNGNPERVTPEIRADHVINQALDFYLKVKGY
jgi:hypothetical protein